MSQFCVFFHPFLNCGWLKLIKVVLQDISTFYDLFKSYMFW